MAEGLLFVCANCQKSVHSWSDGNPYYIDDAGKKRYAYHPDHERLALCVGNDSAHLCLACGAEFKVDSRSPVAACPGCGSAEIVDTSSLGGRRCPYCKAGEFAADLGGYCIS